MVFPGAGRTDDRQALARHDRDVHRLQHFERDRPLLETPLNVARFEYGLSHVSEPRQEQYVTHATRGKE